MAYLELLLPVFVAPIRPTMKKNCSLLKKEGKGPPPSPVGGTDDPMFLNFWHENIFLSAEQLQALFNFFQQAIQVCVWVWRWEQIFSGCVATV